MPNVLIGGQTRAKIDQQPDRCPICHHNIIPDAMFIKQDEQSSIFKAAMEVVYKCPNGRCTELFISYFDEPTGAATDPNRDCFRLKGSRPFEPVPVTFPGPVKEISQSFCDIYEEAHKAEEFGLMQVCGVGYRKALEFLIKDYVIKENPTDKSAIEAMMLGPCIEKYVNDPKTKQVAQRATWLGNDETHYQRRWINKDVTDLKMLIDLVIHLIQVEHLTAEALKSMP